jgi:hypothetical protein
MGKPACYALKLDGPKLLWELPEEYPHPMGGDGASYPRIGYRDGIVYFGAEGSEKKAFVAVNANDGKILHKYIPAAGWGQFHLWGDKFVLIGDNSHESMGGSCSYTPLTLDLKPSGQSYAPRGKQGVCGYINPIRDPFADAFQFMRAATGEIWCYDLRAH